MKGDTWSLYLFRVFGGCAERKRGLPLVIYQMSPDVAQGSILHTLRYSIVVDFMVFD